MGNIGDIAITALRIVYGGFFAAIGFYGGWSMLSGKSNPFPPKPGPGAQFQDALLQTGFMIPLMLGSFVIGGLALISGRAAPLGIIILAPAVIVIAFYHVILPGGSRVWGLGWAVALVILAWHYRAAFRPLIGMGS